MITQTITASMTQTSLSKILTRRYDVGREIKFILYKDELLSDPIDLTDYTVVITVIKPDNNFVIQNFVGDTVTITDQMEVVTGTGYYCVHVSKDNETIYTGQGEFIIDDVLISDGELESISEVNGLKFPDDFLTIEDHVAVIDDTVTCTEKTWSSSKISEEIENDSVVVSKTAEGNPIEISDAADAPLVKCVTAITGYQRGAGTPSPDNVRPITAYTEGEIEVRGKNLIDESTVVDGEYLNDSGVATSVANGAYYAQYIPVTSGKYTISFTKANDNLNFYVRIHGYNSSKAWQSLVYKTSSTIVAGGFYSYSFTVPSGISFIRSSFGDDISNVQIESGTTATDYEPYTSTTHTTTWSTQIYQGNGDIIGSVATCNWPIISFNAGWTINVGETSLGVKYADIGFSINNIPLPKTINNAICDSYDLINTTDAGEDGKFKVYATGITVYDNRFTSVAVAKSYLNNVNWSYELATPTTETITTTNLPIKSLLGYNHIESTTGNIEIEYITPDYQPLVDSIVMESERKITKLWDAGFTPSPGAWLEYDFGTDLEGYDAIVIEFVVSGWEGNYSDAVTVYPQIQHLNTKTCYHYVKGTDYGVQFWRVSGTTYGLGAISGSYPPQYKSIYGIKY